MNLTFKVIDIKPNTTEEWINKQVEGLDVSMYFLIDVTPTHKKLFVGYCDELEREHFRGFV
jgi:hypothetical protein